MKRKCEELLGELSDYIDGQIDPELCAEIEKHVGECENCRIMIDTLKMTVTLCRDGKCDELPPELNRKLNNLLRDRWNKKFKKSS